MTLKSGAPQPAMFSLVPGARVKAVGLAHLELVVQSITSYADGTVAVELGAKEYGQPHLRLTLMLPVSEVRVIK